MVQSSKSKYKPPVFLTLFLIFLITLGTSFRFAYLERPIMNADEKVSQLRIVGDTYGSASLYFKENQVYSPREVIDFYTVKKEDTAKDVVFSLSKEDSQHPPLFYLLAFFKSKLGDGSFYNGRQVAAVSGALAILSIFLLSKELFLSQLTGLISSLITAFSVYFLYLSQNFREFSLWVNFLAFSSYFLIRFWRHYDIKSWGYYTFINTLALYTFPLHFLTMVGHFIHLLSSKGGRTKLGLHAFSSIFSIILFTPWLGVMFRGKQQITATTSWLNERYNLLEWGSFFLRSFSDYFYRIGKYPNQIAIYVVATLIFITVAFVSIKKNRSFTVVLFPAVLTILPFILQDLMYGGIRSLQSRYLLPIFLCIVLSIGYAISTLIAKNVWIGSGILAAILTVQLLSVHNYFTSESWYTYRESNYNIKIAQLIKPNETILTSKRLSLFTLGLAYRLPSSVKIKVSDFNRPLQSQELEGVDYILHPSLETLEQAKRYKKIHPLVQIPKLRKDTGLYKVLKN